VSQTTMPRHLPWLIWTVGAGVYFLAFIHRASLGVAGPDATSRLDISATQLGSFILVQLGLYAFMQVPAGLAIDRWGARRVLLASTVAMGCAQVMFGFATSYPLALIARGLLGVGDAAVFIAVLRLAATYFPRRRYAFLTMLTALAGMVGNLVATVPLVIALDTWGWSHTFIASGLASIVYAVLLVRPAVRPAPDAPEELTPARGPRARGVWARPEVRLGFWTHLATLHPALVLSLLWGFPYLTQGLDYSDQAAASMLSLYIGVNVVSSFVVGPLAGRKPRWRMAIGVGVASGLTLSLAGLVLWPGGNPPAWYVAFTFGIAAVGVPTSQIGFHLARDYSPHGSISTATGVVNAGGFVAAIITSVVFGAVLDGLGGPSLPHFRWALACFAGISSIATLIVLISTLGVRNQVFHRMAHGDRVVVPVQIRLWDRAYSRLRGKPLPG